MLSVMKPHLSKMTNGVFYFSMYGMNNIEKKSES
jgi:hypothetical protein